MTDDLEEKVLLGPEQKPIEWMTDFLFNFCKAEHLVQETCNGTSTSEKTCSQLSVHRRFIWCEKNATCFLEGLLSLMGVYAKPVLSTDSDLFRSKEMVEKSKVFCKEDGRFRVEKKGCSLASAIRTCFCTNILCAWSTFSWKCVQWWEVAWKVPTHLSFTVVGQVARPLLQHGCGQASDAWRVRAGKCRGEVSNFSS